MADKPENDADDAASHDAERVSVSPTTDDTEAVDAEIVDADGDGRADTVASDRDGAGEARATDRHDGTRTDRNKKRGIGFGAVLAALVLVALIVGYFAFFSGDDEDAVLAEDAEPGVVVSEAEPAAEPYVPGEGPITGQAAPGTRGDDPMAAEDRSQLTGAQRAAIAAAGTAAASLREEMGGAEEAEAEEAPARAETSRTEAPALAALGFDEEDAPVEPRVEDDAAVVVAEETGPSLSADEADQQDAPARSAAERLRAERRRALEARMAAQRAGDEAETNGAGALPTGDAVPASEATVADAPAPRLGDDDPNALPGMTLREAPPTDPADDPNAFDPSRGVAEADPRGALDDETPPQRATRTRPSAADLLRQRQAAAGAAPAAATGQDDDREQGQEQGEAQPDGTLAPAERSALERLAEQRRAARAAEDQDPGARVPDDAEVAQDDRASQGQPQLIDPRPAVVAVPTLPADGEEAPAQAPAQAPATTGVQEAELDRRLDQVRTGVRQDVLAEAEQVIQRAIAETEREVDALRAALTEQEQRSDQRIVQLQDRLEVLQNRDAGSAQQGVLILALSSLSGEIDQGRPFTRQLDDVERLAPNARSLRSLQPYAAGGLPTEASLRDQFSLVARQALADARRGEAAGPFEKLWANVTGLFSVRERGVVEGDTPAAVISRAEAALERGDLAAANEELAELDGDAAEAFEPWREDAERRVDAQRRIADLERAVLAPAR